MLKEIFKLFGFTLLCIVFVTLITACGDDEDIAPSTTSSTSSGVDSRFVGKWERDESVSGVVEEVHTLVLNASGTASYSWYRDPKNSIMKKTTHSSSGIWRYDKASNRIITDCTTSSTGSAVILDVINVTSTTLVVKQEGASKSRTYTKKK